MNKNKDEKIAEAFVIARRLTASQINNEIAVVTLAWQVIQLEKLLLVHGIPLPWKGSVDAFRQEK